MSPISRSPYSLRARLQASSLLAVLVGYGVLLVAQWQLDRQVRLEKARLAAQEVRLQLPAQGSQVDLVASLEALERPGRWLWIEDSSGQMLAWPAQGENPLVLAGRQQLTAPASDSDVAVRFLRFRGREYLNSSLRISLGTGGQEARLRLLKDVSLDRQQQRQVQLLLIAAAGFTVLLTSALLRLVLRGGLAPLDQLSAQLAAVDADQMRLSKLPSDHQPQELQPIVGAFNDLLDRLADAWELQRTFIDGVAHELRTPITLIRGYAQQQVRRGESSEAAVHIAAEAIRMQRIVRDLLDIARNQSGRLELQHQVIDLDESLLVAFERMQPLASGRLRLASPPNGPARLARVDPDRLQQCLTNLVENAICYAPPPTPIELYSSATEMEVTLHVRDYGPGVSQPERECIFERFKRGMSQPLGPSMRSEALTSGSGLGLYLVRMLITHMGGRVSIEDAATGGAEFLLVLPRVRQLLG